MIWWIVVGLTAWAFVAQFVAWLICGSDADDDQIIGMWAGIFIFIPLVPLYALIYALKKFLLLLRGERREIDIVEEIL